MTVRKGKVTAPPTVKKVSVSGKNVTVSFTRTQGASGSDWVLAGDVKVDAKGNYTGLASEFAYISKNQTAAKIVFKNVKTGIYYVA